MLQGYPFSGTGAAAPTAHNATIWDPILGTAITTLTIRGDKRSALLMGVSFSSDVPGLGSRMELRIGNQPTPVRKLDILPVLDGNLATQPVHVMNYEDLGGIEINEDELIDIRLYDPGAAEIMSGVLWVEDGEPAIEIPEGQMVTLKMGGTNDAGTTFTATGFDMDARKLINERLYTPYEVIVRPEDQMVERLVMKAGKESMTFPPIGRMVYGTAPLQFTGQEYNSSFVVGYAEMVAAAKVEIIIKMIESEGKTAASPSSPKVEKVSAPTVPGVVGPGSVVGKPSGFTSRGGSPTRMRIF